MGQEEAVTLVVASWEPAAEHRDMPPESPRKAKAPARRHGVSRRSSVSRRRAVRPEDDPFLAAYLACTRSGTAGAGRGGSTASRREPKGRRRFTWAGLGLSCKGSGAAVEQSMVKLAKRPELDPTDA